MYAIYVRIQLIIDCCTCVAWFGFCDFSNQSAIKINIIIYDFNYRVQTTITIIIYYTISPRITSLDLAHPPPPLSKLGNSHIGCCFARQVECLCPLVCVCVWCHTHPANLSLWIFYTTANVFPLKRKSRVCTMYHLILQFSENGPMINFPPSKVFSLYHKTNGDTLYHPPQLFLPPLPLMGSGHDTIGAIL